MLGVTFSAQAALLSGQISGLQGSQGPFSWGDGINNLYQEWSVNSADSSDWFYGSSYSISNADVYVYSGLSDPTTISDASLFSYFDSASSG